MPWRQRICLQCRTPRFNLWVRKNSWRREWLPTPVFLPGESHGQRSLVGCSPCGHKESDTAERLTLSLHFQSHGRGPGQGFRPSTALSFSMKLPWAHHFSLPHTQSASPGLRFPFFKAFITFYILLLTKFTVNLSTHLIPLPLEFKFFCVCLHWHISDWHLVDIQIFVKWLDDSIITHGGTSGHRCWWG